MCNAARGDAFDMEACAAMLHLQSLASLLFY